MQNRIISIARPGAREAWLGGGGHKQVWGAQKLVESDDQKTKVFIAKHVENFTDNGENKKVFTAKSAKKRFLPTNSGVMTSILMVSGLELHPSGIKLVSFFGVQSSLGGHNSRLGGYKQWFEGARPRNAPPMAPGLRVALTCTQGQTSKKAHNILISQIASK